jgi:hypothetical protein
VDADHAHDLITRRSITGILVMLNNSPDRWVSRPQKTVEISTNGSELVVSRIATELILEVIYMLRLLGVVLDGPTLMLGDNTSIVLNTSVTSSVLQKKHNAIAYYRVCQQACSEASGAQSHMKNSNLMNSIKSACAPSTFSIFLALELSRMGCCSPTNKGKTL